MADNILNNITNQAGNVKSNTSNVSGLLSADSLSKIGKTSVQGQLSRLPQVPKIPGLPNIPGLSSLPSIPGVPDLKNITDPAIIRLVNELIDIQIERGKIEIEYATNLATLQLERTPIDTLENGQVIKKDPKLTEERYNTLLDNTKKTHDDAIALLNQNQQTTIEAIKNYFKDPFLKVKGLKAKRKARTKTKKVRNKGQLKKALKEKAKAILKNPKKSLPPIIILTIDTVVTTVIDKIGIASKLVDQTNAIIEDANASNDPTKLNNAKIARDNAIKVIQRAEDIIRKVNTSLKSIEILITILDIVVSIIGEILLLIPVPSPLPDFVTIPKEVFRKKVYEPASKILTTLSAYLPIITGVLDKLINKLEEEKARLLPINGILDKASTSGVPGTTTLNSMSTSGKQFGTTDYGTYRGFKFAIKEETKPGSDVRGFKRHYAEAIDTNNVAVLKSELSFTLDPQDLIESLKLIIDRENLIA
jgi:hypothetical protein